MLSFFFFFFFFESDFFGESENDVLKERKRVGIKERSLDAVYSMKKRDSSKGIAAMSLPNPSSLRYRS